MRSAAGLSADVSPGARSPNDAPAHTQQQQHQVYTVLDSANKEKKDAPSHNLLFLTRMDGSWDMLLAGSTQAARWEEMLMFVSFLFLEPKVGEETLMFVSIRFYLFRAFC